MEYVIRLSAMKLPWLILFLFGIALIFSRSYSEAGALSLRDSDIEKADRLGEGFQKQGPWSRQESRGNGFSVIPQPEEYRTASDSQAQKDESEYGMNQYPLCYNPYAGLYEYCYPRESSLYRSRFRSSEFRSWWRKGRICPPGYYFVPDEGCYRK